MNFKCPGCGGDNELEFAENEFVKCSYCNNYSYIDLDGLVSVYTFKSRIDVRDVSHLLKKDFKRTGFSETFEIMNSYPVYIPFWDMSEKSVLLKGSSQFKNESVVRPSGEKTVFDFDSIAGSIEMIEPDMIPEIDKDKVLCFLPFYKILIKYRGEEYGFLVNGMNGEVTGDPIPFVSDKDAKDLFPMFITIFFVAFIVNLLFDHLILSVFLNVVAIYILFSFSISKINRKLYKDGR